MKNKLLVLLLFISYSCFSQYKTYVPDDNFELYLESNGMGDNIAYNDSVSSYYIFFVASLNIDFQGIYDLTGIDGFVNLQDLSCRGNYLSYLDLSNNSLLSSLNCSGNASLSTIDLRNGNNSALTSFTANNTLSLSCILVDDISYFQTYWSAYSNLFTGLCGQTWAATNDAKPLGESYLCIALIDAVGVKGIETPWASKG